MLFLFLTEMSSWPQPFTPSIKESAPATDTLCTTRAAAAVAQPQVYWGVTPRRGHPKEESPDGTRISDNLKRSYPLGRFISDFEISNEQCLAKWLHPKSKKSLPFRIVRNETTPGCLPFRIVRKDRTPRCPPKEPSLNICILGVSEIILDFTMSCLQEHRHMQSSYVPSWPPTETNSTQILTIGPPQ